MAFEWRGFSGRTARVKASVIRETLKLTEKGDILSFAGGLPAPELFPLDRIEECARHVLATAGAASLQYSTSEGYAPLREFLAGRLRRQGMPVETDDILITHGSQQGIDLTGKILLDKDDVVFFEDPTYLGAVQAYAQYEARYVTFPTDVDGMILDDVEAAVLRERPKLIYLVPNFHNPLGITMSLERRQSLVAIAHKHGIPIIEDDPYSELRYVGESIPHLYTIAGGEGVVYLGTFSKLVAPGLRIGWLVCKDEAVRYKLVAAKQASDLHTGSFSQRVVAEYCARGYLDPHIEVIRRTYGERRQLMLDAIGEHFPAEVRYNESEGGLFIWCMLPEGVDAQEVLKRAMALQVAFIPGYAFYANGGGRNTFRLNYSNQSPANIAEGIARLGRVIHTVLSERKATEPAPL